MVAELLEGRVDAEAANSVRLGTRSALVAALLHFSELETELELLGSGRNVALIEDQVDAL
jgi:UDP-N-acetylenolpyruvoylglucosamine reductase